MSNEKTLDAMNRRMDIRQLTPDTFGVKFGAIVVDPPWDYDNNKNNDVKNGAVQYDQLTVKELGKLKISDLALPNSLLLMWTTSPKLDEAMTLLKAWGYKYVTAMYWVKQDSKGNLRHGTGHWAAGSVEVVYIGKRGNVSPPGNKYTSAFGGRIGKHSEKPAFIHEYVEGVIAEAKGPYPLNGPCLELFARKSRTGWYAVGNELDKSLEYKNEVTGDVYRQGVLIR